MSAVADNPESVAHEIADLAWAILAPSDPVAAIVHGSVATGDFVPGRSDIDLLFVVERGLSDREIGALRHLLCELTSHALDVRIVTRAVAAAPTLAPPMEFYFGRHDDAVEIEMRSTGEADLLVEFRMAREHGRSLRGTSPREIVGNVPDAWILRYGLALLQRWRTLADDDEHAELMVLTACRIWQFAATGALASKSAAARWATAQDPDLTAIRAAVRRRHGAAEAPISPGEIGDVLDAARSAVELGLAALPSP